MKCSPGDIGTVAADDGLVISNRVGRCAVPEGTTTECFAAVGGQPRRRIGPGRHDSRGVQIGLHLIVVLLDLDEVDGVAESGGLEEIAGVGPQHRHFGEFLAVSLEVIVVDGVESNEGGEQSDVSFGDR